MRQPKLRHIDVARIDKLRWKIGHLLELSGVDHVRRFFTPGPQPAMNTYAPSLAGQEIAIDCDKTMTERIDWEQKRKLRTDLVAMGALTGLLGE